MSKELPILKVLKMVQFYETVFLWAFLYVLFELLATSKWGYYFFLSLACLMTVFIVTRFWTSLPTIVSLLILQSPFPAFRGYTKNLGYNWYTIDFFGVSIVHYLTALITIIALLHGSLKGFRLKRREARMLAFLSIAFFIELAVGLECKLNWYQYAVDAAIFGYVIIFLFLGLLTPLRIRQRLIQHILIILPLSLAWGNILLTLLARRFPLLAMHYDVAGIYLIVGLLLNCFSPLTWSLNPAIRRFSFVTLIVFLSLHIASLGSFMILAMAIVGLIVALWWLLYSRPQINLKVLAALILVSLVASGSIYYYAYKVGNPVTRQKIEQIASLFTSGGNPLQMRHSTAVRLIELINIWETLQKSPLTFLFGRGAGGYFTDSSFPFPYLTVTDYSPDQRSSHKFYRPHNSPGYVLLKYGLIGTTFWFAILTTTVMRVVFSRVICPPRFSLGLLLTTELAIVYGFTAKNSLLIGLLAALYMTALKELSNLRGGKGKWK